MATEIGHRISDLSDQVMDSGKTTYANRLAEFSISISSILARGSSCPTKVQFATFVGEARAATMEIANLILFLAERDLLSENEESELVNMLKREAKMLENFRQSLEKAERPVAVA